MNFAYILAALSDDAARTKMAANCRRVALEEYSIETQASGYLKLYETLISRAANSAVSAGVPSAKPQAAG